MYQVCWARAGQWWVNKVEKNIELPKSILNGDIVDSGKRLGENMKKRCAFFCVMLQCVTCVTCVTYNRFFDLIGVEHPTPKVGRIRRLRGPDGRALPCAKSAHSQLVSFAFHTFLAFW